MSFSTVCAECGWETKGGYHPYIACLIYKATGHDPLPYLDTVVEDGKKYGALPQKLSDWPPISNRRKRSA